LPRKTDSKNPADWLFIAESDLELVQLAADHTTGFAAARSKLAEILEKVLKAELIRTGWPLEKTHDLNRLFDLLTERRSDLLRRVPITENALRVAVHRRDEIAQTVDNPAAVDQEIRELFAALS
jgi:HEPN domain-containing protein